MGGHATSPVAASFAEVGAPLVILGVSLLVIIAALMAGRRARRRAAAAVPDWQQSHGRVVDRWMQAQEGRVAVLRPPVVQGMAARPPAPPLDADLDARMAAAVAAAPVRAMASALKEMRTSIAKAIRALEAGKLKRSDRALAAYHHHRDRSAAMLAAVLADETRAD